MERSRDSRLARWSAAMLLLGIVAFAALQAPRLDAGGVTEQLDYVRQYPLRFKLENVVGALLTLPSAALISWIANERRVDGDTSAALSVAAPSLVAYVLLINVAYASQYVLVTAWLDASRFGANAMRMLYIDATASIPGLLKLLGYTACSIASVSVARPWAAPSSVSRWVTGLLFLSGAVGLVGWLECVVLSSNAGRGLALSGFLVVPYALAVLVTQRGERS